MFVGEFLIGVIQAVIGGFAYDKFAKNLDAGSLLEGSKKGAS
jgi:hypothetical protein